MVDTVHLGRKVDVNANSNSHPHPILIKLNSCWDKHLLLASCHKLRGYFQHELFLSEDLLLRHPPSNVSIMILPLLILPLLVVLNQQLQIPTLMLILLLPLPALLLVLYSIHPVLVRVNPHHDSQYDKTL